MKEGREKAWSFPHVTVVLVYFSLFFVNHVEGLWCERSPAGVISSKLPGDNGYKIVISGDPDKPDKYIPEAVYTVRLQGPGDQYTVKKFSGFLLVAEPADGLSSDTSAGSFQLVGDSLARFSEYCPHAVKHASELPKAEVQVRWTAPPATAGCVSFKATVIMNKGHWFMDDGELTKTLCPETDVGPDESETTEPCCACDEAKYELTFEGLWSILTHPKDFPADAWSAHFSDIIGASHSPTFRFWKKDDIASDGLKQIAENGDSKDVESELKAESGNIRTIIKARGLRHPNIYGHKTFAVFRADKDHNLISLVSKIAPSPDWFVGVSGLNLCLKNCSWSEGKVIPLYPWDAGTDSGITYGSPKEPTFPQGKITGITWQEDDRSPFFDPAGNMVKPFARLRITKQRSYDTSCPERMENLGETDDYDDYDEDEMDDRDKPECEMTDWSNWSDCSSAATCGRGFMKKFRRYVNEALANDFGCHRRKTREKQCDVPCGTNNQYGGASSWGVVDNGLNSDGSNNPCATTEFHPWSGCSVTCGQGLKRRYREFLRPALAHASGCDRSVLVNTERCLGAYASCTETEERPGCQTTEWTEWGPCSATCGKGTQVRTRRYMYPPPHTDCKVDLYDDQSCEGQQCTAQEICTQPVDLIKCRGSYTKYHYDMSTQTCKKFSYGGCGGTQNVFDSQEECENTCGFIAELPSDSHSDYSFNTYSTNTRMNPYQSSSSYSSRYRPQSPQSKYSSSYSNYGQSDGRYPGSTSSFSNHYLFNSNSSRLSVDCEVSEWTSWSNCTVACGRGHKYRTRYIKVYPQNGGKPCPSFLDHKRKCKGTDCPPGHLYGGHQHHNNYNRNNYQHHSTSHNQYSSKGIEGYIN